MLLSNFKSKKDDPEYENKKNRLKKVPTDPPFLNYVVLRTLTTVPTPLARLVHFPCLLLDWC